MSPSPEDVPVVFSDEEMKANGSIFFQVHLMSPQQN